MYAWEFRCYDEIDSPDLDRYDRQIHDVTVWVVAPFETDANALVRSIIPRGNYELRTISALDHQGRAIGD